MMKHITQKLAVLLGACLLAVTALALPAAAAPQVDTTSPVNDYADILSRDTEEYVTSISAALQNNCGAEIGVYTVDRIGNSTMEGYAYSVLNAWGLGDANKDNGVLLLLAPGEDDYYVTRGTGLESQLSISTLSTILDDDMEPNWVNGDYDAGTRQTVRAIAERLCNIYGIPTSTLDGASYSGETSGGSEMNIMTWILGIGAILLIIIVLSALVTPRGPRGPRPPRGPGGHVGEDMFWYGMGRASRRPRRPPPPPPPRGGPGGFGSPGPGGFGGSRPSRPSRPTGGAGRSGGSRPSRPSGGYHTGGGSSRGGGVGRHH